MTFQTKIIGADFETNCDCCGRHLKVGVQLSGLGVYGADCIRAAMPVDRKRYRQSTGAVMTEYEIPQSCLNPRQAPWVIRYGKYALYALALMGAVIAGRMM